MSQRPLPATEDEKPLLHEQVFGAVQAPRLEHALEANLEIEAQLHLKRLMKMITRTY
jgi:hypothetical protein